MSLNSFIRSYAHLTSSYLSTFLLNLLPPACLLCGRRALEHNLCMGCLQDLPSLPQNCPKCARFLVAQQVLICGKCLTSPPPYEATFTLFPYEWPIINLITGLKFKGELAYAKLLGDLFIQQMKHWYKELPTPEVIIPVPLHPARLAERGFNQALEIARPIAAFHGISLDTLGIKRARATLPQSSLSAKEREDNIKNAFTTHRDYNGKHIAIIDDVITTGHTIRELSQLLRKHGAKTIHIWSAARNG